MNQLENIFSTSGFPVDDVLEIMKWFSLKKFESGDFFLRDGYVGESIGFINEGMFHFYYDNGTEEITTYVAFKHDFILSVQSLFSQKSSKENIRALVDSEVWVIKKTDFERLQETVKDFKEFYIEVLEKLLVCIDESRLDYIALAPEERYQKLMKREPQLVQQIPLQYLSSLVGISPHYLGRMRNSIM